MKLRFFSLLLVAGLMSSLIAARAAPLDRPPAGAFTIVVIPDTQGYDGDANKRAPAAKTNPVLENHIRWITENIRDQNIVFVTHVGDITDINNHAQWKIARHLIDGLHGVIPYSLTVGNHDMEERVDGNASLFQRYFGADRFKDFSWYGGSFEPSRPDQSISGNNANSFQLFSAGGFDFIHLSLECNAPDDVLLWADGLLRQYASRRALITTHMDLGPAEKGHPEPKGRMRWLKIQGDHRNTPEQMWEKLYRKHANLGFVFSGDQRTTTAVRLDTTGDNGNIVHALMSDYTSSGPLRLCRFLSSENRVQVITFDTTKREIVTDAKFVHDPAQHQFSLDYPMLRRPATTLPPGDPGAP